MLAGVMHGRRNETQHRKTRQCYRGDAKRAPVPPGWMPVYGVERRESGDTSELVVYNNVGRIHHLRDIGEISMKTLPWVRLVLIIGFILINFLVVV